MHETPHAYVHFEPPYLGLIGGTLLDGWLVAKSGQHYTDVRVTSGGHTFPGIYGIPRKDLAEFFGAPSPYLLAGFSVTITLQEGRHHLALEACTIAGQWETIDIIERDISPAEAQPDTEGRQPVNAAAYGELLQHILRDTGAKSGSAIGIARDLIASTPSRHHLRHPALPFRGHLDQPGIWDRSEFGRLVISGWIYHETQPIVRVFASADLQAMQNVSYGRHTPFLNTSAINCGYDGFLDLPSQLPRPATVRVYAELEDGTWHLGSVARFQTQDDEQQKRAYIPYSPWSFGRACIALRCAIIDRGWQLPQRTELRAAIKQVWQDYKDNASPVIPTPSSAVVNRESVEWPLTVVTHNLNLEGAPLFLLELGRALHESKIRFNVLSAKDGPLRTDFESLGSRVQIVDSSAVMNAQSSQDFEAGLTDLAHQAGLERSGAVLVNTLSCFWGVLLSQLANRPSLFYIHESTPPRRFFRHSLVVARAAESAFRAAQRVSFLTNASQRYYEDLSTGSNYRVNPGWVDVVDIDAFRTICTAANARAELGIASGHTLVINVGTVCERKGQHVFARAVDLLWRDAPELAAQAIFVMIGGRDTAYDARLRDFVRQLNRPNIRIQPETTDVRDWYAAADLFVCSSFEESFPRVVLEAMAFLVPMICSNIHGIPEIARPEHEAILVPPGDTFELANALRRQLANSEEGRRRAHLARERVINKYELRRVMPSHVALTQEVISMGIPAQ